MDVSDLIDQPLHAGFYVSVAAIIVLAAAALASIVAAALYDKEGFWFVATIAVALTLPLAGISSHIHENNASQRNESLQSRLFEGYGITLSEPAEIVEKIDGSGDEGVVTEINRGAETSKALLRFEDGKLVVKDAAGIEIPAHNQSTESSN